MGGYKLQNAKHRKDKIVNGLNQESYHKVKYDRPGECSPEKDCLR